MHHIHNKLFRGRNGIILFYVAEVIQSKTPVMTLSSYIRIFTQVFQNTLGKEKNNIIPISQMKKLRYRAVRGLAQGHPEGPAAVRGVEPMPPE